MGKQEQANNNFPIPNFSDDIPLGFKGGEFETREKYLEAIKQLSENWSAQIIKFSQEHGKNPYSETGEQELDKPDHFELKTTLDDGRDLQCKFINMGKFQGVDISPNARLEISLTPENDNQYGYSSTSDGPNAELSYFRVYLGEPTHHSKWVHFDDPTSDNVIIQHARLLRLVVNEFDIPSQ